MPDRLLTVVHKMYDYETSKKGWDEMSIGVRAVVCLALWCLVPGSQTGFSQTGPPAGKASPPLPIFEVASVKVTPAESVGQSVLLKCENGRLTMRNIRLSTHVQWAYDVHPADMILPGWTENADAPHYDIDGRAEGAVPQAQVKLMLQQLLADRFKFAAHHEMKVGVHQVLRVGKAGHKLQDAAPITQLTAPVKSDPVNLRIICRGASLTDFLYRLWSMGTGRIYDQTGLTGRYDFTLDYGRFIDPAAPPEYPLNALRAARIDAIRIQLGLEIVETKIAVDTFVVDRVEKIPAEN